MHKPKILYAIQGTGNGHIARAREIIPVLGKYADVDVLISGNESEIELPIQPKYIFTGITLKYDAQGGVSYLKTLTRNNLLKAAWEVCKLPVRNYDLVISDFEFVASWSSKLKSHRCIGLSHQSALLSKHVPKPKESSLIGKLILKYYAPAIHNISFHFKPYDFFMFHPVIRKEVRAMENSYVAKNKYTVYLPAFGVDFLRGYFAQFSTAYFEIFTKKVEQTHEFGNGRIQQIESDNFLKSMETCAGVITSAGFETPAEAIYLNKKLLVVPIANQFEQLMNAKALEEIGVPVVYQLNDASSHVIMNWINKKEVVHEKFPDLTERLVQNEILPYVLE
ncbi:MAG: glycosyl transferase [Schleiferiaceae bacterium]|jgi:uncharacterized protein (TIGR00661 family)|nr:glycosyl transferase [Schleiferiaceae bacterium]